MNKKNIFYISLITFIISGCSVNHGNDLEPGLYSKNLKADMTTFEANLVRVAAKAEKHWRDYYSLLEKRKNLNNDDLSRHIPINMSKNINLTFEGRISELLDKIASESGYSIHYKDMIRESTPITAVRYDRTSIWDILQMTMAKIPDFDIKIDESNLSMTIYPKY